MEKLPKKYQMFGQMRGWRVVPIVVFKYTVVQTLFSIMQHKARCMVIDRQMVIVRKTWKLFDIYLKELIMTSKLLTFFVLGFHENIINYKYDFTSYQRKGSKY